MTRSPILGPLGSRLALAFLGVALGAVGVLAGLTLAAARDEVAALEEDRRDRDAADVVAAVAQAYSEAGGWVRADLGGAVALAAAARADLVVVATDGEPVATPPDDMRDLMDRMHGDGTTTDELGPPRRLPVVVDGITVGAAVLRFPAGGATSPEQQVRRALGSIVLAGAGAAAAVALAAAVLVSRRLTRPLTALADAARRVETGERGAATGMGDAPGELGAVSRAFDQMSTALAREDELRRALIADVAHELRTPATVLRGGLEELVDGLVEPTPDRLTSLHDEILRLSRVIGDLEALASAQAASLDLARERVDVARVTAEAVDGLRPRFADAGLVVETHLEPAVVDGDAGRLHQVVVNLLTNALKFTPAGGTVSVRVTAEDGLARLAVSDTGPGIAPSELPHVFERFWRGPSAGQAAGSGIGLAIVAELVAAHGGRVSAESTGRGATFTVVLPR